MIPRVWACSIVFVLCSCQAGVRCAENPTQSFDVVVYGATTPAVVAAVRCARDGLNVALVSPTQSLASSDAALGAFESHYRGFRAPILQELADGVKTYYRERYGKDSQQYRDCTGGSMTTFEPHVLTRIVNDLLSNETRIRFLPGYVPSNVELNGRLIKAVTFQGRDNEQTLRLAGHSFVEASYEGDLMALAGAEFRVGREGREEFEEPSAGRVFTRWMTGRFPRAAVEGRLNLTTYGANTSEPLAGSSGEGDDNIQAYGVRLCVTNDPNNRRVLESPPAQYDRKLYLPILLSPAEKEKLQLPFHHRFLIYSLRETAEMDHIFHGQALPNRKRSWNATNFTGAGKQYPTASWNQRDDIKRRHFEFALGLLYFLQNDDEVPEDVRSRASEWGLARDEFVATENLPPEIYVREARRLVGRSIFTEHDAVTAPGLERAPLHSDSIGITEGSLDSLPCTMERLPGSLCDGQLLQMDVSRPGQVPFGTLLPREIDNLVVVTTVSATHVGWGALRLMPTLVHIAESGATAVVLAARENIPPAQLDVRQLQRQLAANRIMISFFNDLDVSIREPYVEAMECLAGLGFYCDYNARPQKPLTRSVAGQWAGTLARVMEGKSDPMAEGTKLLAIEEGNEEISLADFRDLMKQELGGKESALERFDQAIHELDRPTEGALDRATACVLIYNVISPVEARAHAASR